MFQGLLPPGGQLLPVFQLDPSLLDDPELKKKRITETTNHNLILQANKYEGLTCPPGGPGSPSGPSFPFGPFATTEQIIT